MAELRYREKYLAQKINVCGAGEPTGGEE